jgi:hypothetical protein
MTRVARLLREYLLNLGAPLTLTLTPAMTTLCAGDDDDAGDDDALRWR